MPKFREPSPTRRCVFIAWSGSRSRAVAQTFREWLPSLVNASNPWMSETDILKGALWHSELHSHLRQAAAGIVCLTPENLESPWILYETGALSNALTPWSQVCTYLHEVNMLDLKGPWAQFQHTTFDKEEIRKLVKDINKCLAQGGVPEEQLNRTFDGLWPKLEESLKNIPAAPPAAAGKRPPRRDTTEILEDLVVMVRESRGDLAELAKLLVLDQSRQDALQIEELRAREKWAEQATNLTTDVIKASTAILRILTEELRRHSRVRRENASDAANDLLQLKERMLQQVYRNVRTVFEADTRGIDTTTWPHNFFKVALFRPDPERPRYLKRVGFDYPEGLEPSPVTQFIDTERYHRSAAALAFRNQDILVIQDIKKEASKDLEVTRWVDLRPGQSDDYESMVCAAIVSGRKVEPDRRCLGVLVIDTNRREYFREDRNYLAFLGTLLNPFRTILTLVLELDLYFGYGRPSDAA